jgi:hypothetical protein
MLVVVELDLLTAGVFKNFCDAVVAYGELKQHRGATRDVRKLEFSLPRFAEPSALREFLEIAHAIAGRITPAQCDACPDREYERRDEHDAGDRRFPPVAAQKAATGLDDVTRRFRTSRFRLRFVWNRGRFVVRHGAPCRSGFKSARAPRIMITRRLLPNSLQLDMETT